jgi:hypothetical protein
MFDIFGKVLLGGAAGKVAEVAENIVDRVIDEVTDEVEISNYTSKITAEAIKMLLSVPGMTQAHSRDFKRAMPVFALKDGTIVKIYQNPVRFEHVFLADSDGQMIFGCYVGWEQSMRLKQVIEQIKVFLA